jgi:hypothetical protein
LATKRREAGELLPLWRMATFRRQPGKLALHKEVTSFQLPEKAEEND